MYTAGGVVLDWIYCLKRRLDATHDVRSYDVAGGNFKDVSVTVRAGAGRYQPLGSKLLLILGLTYGRNFFSDYEKAVQFRGMRAISCLDVRLFPDVEHQLSGRGKVLITIARTTTDNL